MLNATAFVCGLSPEANARAFSAEENCNKRTLTWYFASPVWYLRLAPALNPSSCKIVSTWELFEYEAATVAAVRVSPSGVPTADPSDGTGSRKKRRSPLCTPLATFPVTVEDGVGLEVVTTGAGEDDDDGDGVGVGVGEDVWLGTGLGAATSAAL
jgi:hypothetical protein